MNAGEITKLREVVDALRAQDISLRKSVKELPKGNRGYPYGSAYAYRDAAALIEDVFPEVKTDNNEHS